MSLLPPSAEKHKLDGIGGASAAVVFAALSSNPYTAWMTAGIQGKIFFWVCENIFAWLASVGLVLLNVGAENLLAVIDKANFDSSLESAEKFIAEIRKTGRDLTPQEIKEIDDKVIVQFRKFAKIARKR